MTGRGIIGLLMFLLLYLSVWAQKRWDPAYYSRFDLVTIQGQAFFNAPIDTASFIPELLNAAIFFETNRKRNLAQVPVLKHDARLEKSAQGHSSDMVAQGYFSHSGISDDQKTLEQRLKKAGLHEGNFGENLIQWSILNINEMSFIPPSVSGYFKTLSGDSVEMHSYQSLAEEIVDGWMNSQGHRINILNRSFSHLGVGSCIYFTGDSIDRIPGVKCTQNFARVVPVSHSLPRKRASSLPADDNASPAELNDRMNRTRRNMDRTTKENNDEFVHGYELIAVKRNARVKVDPLPFEPDHKKTKRKRDKKKPGSVYLPFAAIKDELARTSPLRKNLPDNTPFAGNKKILAEIQGIHEPIDYLAFALPRKLDGKKQPFKPSYLEMPFVLVVNEDDTPDRKKRSLNTMPFVAGKQTLSMTHTPQKAPDALPFGHKGLRFWFSKSKRKSNFSRTNRRYEASK